MSNAGGKVAAKFRNAFPVVPKDVIQWFPGHMGKGLKQMQQQLKNVDCIVEVHDARVPISGHYADFNKTLTSLKPHIFILNKMDLADMTYQKQITSQLKKQGLSNVLFTNLKNHKCKGTSKILPLAKKLIRNSDRFNRSHEETFTMMIIGIPNVGKSSLINRLRANILNRPKATQVGGVAGITRSVLTRIKIAENPDFYLLDTPGILIPNMRDTYSGLKLALIACLQDHLVGSETLADFLLFWLNKHERFEYVEKLGLSEPNDNIRHVLIFIAAKFKRTLNVKGYDGRHCTIPDTTYAANYFLSLFRKGELGLYCLDQDILCSELQNYPKQEQLA